MQIDSIFTGSEVVSVTPVAQYVDGERTDTQAKNADGVALWSVEIAVKSGAFILPVRVKVASAQAPTSAGQVVRFSGVEANAWKRGEIAYTAEAVHAVEEGDLAVLLGGESDD